MSWLHSFHPTAVAFSFGPVSIYWYGIGYVVAMIVGFGLIIWLAKGVASRLRGKDRLDVGFWVVLGGLLGARLWYVITVTPLFYFTNPLEILAVWHGGMAIHGGIIGGAVALWWQTRARFFAWADLFAPAIAIGQGIGRWGNYFNQELYGWPTNSKWGIPIDPANRVSGFEQFSYFQPVFLWESLLNIVLGIILIFCITRVHPPPNLPLLVKGEERINFSSLLYSRGRLGGGSVFALYLIGYGVIRFLISFLRIEPLPMFAGLQVHQWTAVFMIIIGLLLFYNKYLSVSRSHA